MSTSVRFTIPSGTLKGFPNPPAMGRGEQSSPASRAITLIAVAATASLAACNDLAPPGSKQKPTVTTTEPPKTIEPTPPPAEAPGPTAAAPTTPPAAATEIGRTPVT